MKPTTVPALDALLPGVVALARDAGRAILEVYAGAFAVQTKADATPLTEADLRAHRLLLDGLARLAPGIPAISEESPAPPFAERTTWRTLWLVDPLDGTREFVGRSGEFSVNIALVCDGAPVLGVVHAPVRDVAWCGARGAGAFRVDGASAPRAIRARVPSATPPRIVASRSHRGAGLDGFLGRVGEHQLLAAGSALKFGLVAEGAADVYPRVGPTSEWDTAAGHAVAVAAGARVVDRAGRELEYNARETLVNPDFACYADAARPWHALL